MHDNPRSRGSSCIISFQTWGAECTSSRSWNKRLHDFYPFLMAEPEPSSGQNPQINSMTAGFVLPFQHVVVLDLRICWRMFEIYPPGNQRIHTYPLPVGTFESMMFLFPGWGYVSFREYIFPLTRCNKRNVFELLDSWQLGPMSVNRSR